jgi:ankyrin repeat protein
MPTENQYALLKACLNNDIDQVNALLKQGTSPDCWFDLKADTNYIYPVPLLYIACHYKGMLKFEEEYIVPQAIIRNEPKEVENCLAIIRSLLDHPEIDPNVEFSTDEDNDQKETLVYQLVEENFPFEVFEEYCNNPKVDINKTSWGGYTPLDRAFLNGDDNKVSFLLKNKRLDPNATLSNRTSMLMWLFDKGLIPMLDDYTEIYQKVLKDVFIYYVENDLNLLDPAYDTNLEIITYLFKTYYGDDCTCIPKEQGVIQLRFPDDSGYEANEVNLTPEYFSELESLLNKRRAALLLALVVFKCDGLLKVKESCPTGKVVRFFNSVGKLPLDMQMIATNRVYDIAADVVPPEDKEAASKFLARGAWSSR